MKAVTKLNLLFLSLFIMPVVYAQGIEDLPFEVREKVIAGASIEDILALCLTSKEMAKTCETDNLWNLMVKRDFQLEVSNEDLKKVQWGRYTHKDFYKDLKEGRKNAAYLKQNKTIYQFSPYWRTALNVQIPPEVPKKLTGSDLKGEDLRNVNFGEVHLEFANLTGANLSNSKLSYTKVLFPSGAHLYGAILRDADLSKAILEAADLRKSDLTNAILTDTDLTNVKIKGAFYYDYSSGKALKKEVDRNWLKQRGAKWDYNKGPG